MNKHLSYAVTVACVLNCASLADAQLETAITGAGIVENARTVIRDLQNLGTSLTGNGNAVVNNVVTQMNGQLDRLNGILGVNIKEPLANAGVDAQNIARSLQIATERAGQLVAMQRRCALQDIHTLIGALATLGAQLKHGVWFVDEGHPRVDSIQFAGHQPGIIPSAGGTSTLKGYGLWATSEMPPQIRLLSENRETQLASFVPKPGSNGDEAVIEWPPDIVKAQAGKCLAVQIVARQEKRFLWWRSGERTLPEVVLPLCVPEYYATEAMLQAGIHYDCPVSTDKYLDEQVYYAENSRCGETQAVTITKGWDLPAGCRIDRVDIGKGGLTRFGEFGVSSSFSGGSVTLSGTLSEANCTKIPITGYIFHSHAVWQYFAKPHVVCDGTAHFDAQGVSEWVAARSPQTDICIEIGKSCVPDQSDAEAAVQLRSGEFQGEVLRFANVRATQAGADFNSKAFSFGNLNGTYRPGGTGRDAQVCVSLAVQACGY